VTAGETLTEAAIQKQIIDYLETCGHIVIRLNAGKGRNNQRLAPTGTPDLVAVLPGRVVWIEVKTDLGELSQAQRTMHNRLRMRRQKVIVARDVSDVEGLR
jgi:hypothetical protein